jgi:hypothetical protein
MAGRCCSQFPPVRQFRSLISVRFSYSGIIKSPMLKILADAQTTDNILDFSL